MDSLTGLTVGVDLADQASAICVVDGAGEVVQRMSVPTNADVLRALFSKGRYDRVVIEACTNASWVGWLLKDLGQRVVVAHPASIGLIHGTTRKNDQRDAEKLARLARVDESLVFPTHLRSRIRAEVLADIRARATLVAARTQLVNSTKSLAKMVGVRLPRCTPDGLPERVADLQAAHPTLHATLRPLMASLLALNDQIYAADKRLEGSCERFEEVGRLRKIHGVGPITALTFVLVIDDPTRFPRTRDVGAYLGLVPKQDQTGQTDRALRISKAGHRYLRSLLVQCARFTLRERAPDTDLKRWGTAIASRGGKRAKSVATVAVARRLAVTMLAIWKRGDTFVPHRGEVITTSKG